MPQMHIVGVKVNLHVLVILSPI